MKKLLLLLSFVTATLSAQAEGPGLKQQTYKQGELFKIMSSFDSTKHHVRGHAAMIMFKGYLAMVEAMDSGKGDAAFVFYDISDPKTPKRVASYADENTKELFEGHNYAFTVIDDRDIVFLIAKRGLQIWDWTDIHQPKIISKLDMPLLSGGAYDRTAWWVAAQYPKLYLGGTNTGLYIIDAKDLQKPKVDKRISINKLGGFKVGSVFACGNLLVANTFDNRGISLFDISNPLEPQLQSTIKEPFGYTTLYNGRYVYGIGETPKIWDISNAQKPLLVSKYKGPKMGSKGGYAIFQDGFLHQGVSSTYVKIDVRDPVNPKVVGKQSKSIRKKDWDGAHVVGNLTVIACDHGTGSHIVAHQCEIDKKGPGVNFASPANGSKNVATTSRIGFSFTDEIDHRSINKKSFMVREVGGKSIAVTWSCNNSLLNFTPVDGLKNNTTYEVILAKGGIKDQVENGIEKAYRLVFSTGSQVSNFKIAVEDTKPGVVNDVLAYKVLSPFKGVEYSWDFGDGTKRTAFSKNPEHKHQFNKAGRYQVILFARKGEQQASVSLTQIISNPLTAQAPKNSATLIYDKELKRLWNVNPDNNSLTVCDAKTLVKLREIPCGTKPRTLTFVDKQVWVVNEESTDIHIFDRATFKFIKKIKLPYGCQPYGILAGKNSGYVSTQGSGEVLRYSSGELSGRIKYNGKLRGLALTADGKRLFATRFISSDANAEIIEINTASFSRKNDIHLAIDPGPDTEDKGRGLPNYLSQIIISPDGKSAWVPSKKDNIQRGKQRDRQALTFESSVRSIVSKIDLQTSKEVLSARHDFNDRDMANAACFSPLGDLLFVASQGSNSVEVLDASNSQILSAVLNTGSAPQGLLVDDQNRLYVHNYLSRTLAVYDISKLLDGSGILETQVAEIKLVKNELLPAALLRGKKTFHFAGDPRMSLDGYISCASCHQDGGQDGRVWDFTDRGEGLRNTISLNGRSGTAHGRLHWSANFDEVQDFEHDIRGPFGGEGLIKDMHNSTIKDFYPSLGQKKAGMSKDLDEMALYVTSLNRVPASPYRSSDGTMTAQAKAGKKIFNKLSCYTCHGGQTYTDSASLYLHDVGTISAATGKRLGKKIPGLDTPTLRGLWATAPYLHDGSAATLKEVLIDKNKKGIHGDTAQLSKAELEELMAYLQQLDESNAPAQSYKPGKIGKSTFVPSFVNSDNVRILKTQVGVSVYSDKDLKLTELPGFLQGSELIQTRDADKKHTYPYALVKFKLDYQSRIFIAFPKIKNKRAPNYHSGWKLEKQSLKINSQEYHLLSKTFAAGPVFLANARNKKFMYFAFIKKDK